MRIGGTTVDSGEFTKLGHEFVGTTHRAGKSPADAEVELAGSLLAEAGVERDNFNNLDRGDVEFLRDPVDRCGANEAEAMLDFV